MTAGGLAAAGRAVAAAVRLAARWAGSGLAADLLGAATAAPFAAAWFVLPRLLSGRLVRAGDEPAQVLDVSLQLQPPPERRCGREQAGMQRRGLALPGAADPDGEVEPPGRLPGERAGWSRPAGARRCRRAAPRPARAGCSTGRAPRFRPMSSCRRSPRGRTIHRQGGRRPPARRARAAAARAARGRGCHAAWRAAAAAGLRSSSPPPVCQRARGHASLLPLIYPLGYTGFTCSRRRRR